MNEIAITTTIIMLAGVLGCIVPALPGPPLVFIGALFYAYQSDWAQVSWPSLSVLFLLMLVGSTSNVWLGYFGARKGGASIWASVAAFFGGLLGLMILHLPGLFIGSIGAIVAVEYSQHKDWKKVLRAGTGYLAGYLLSMVVELLVCLLMIAIFLLAIML